MKKVISIILCSLMIISSLSFSVSAKAVNNNYKTSETKEENSSLLYVNKKYIFSNEDGIYVKNSLKAKSKKITSKVATGNILSNGKKIYFATRSNSSKEVFLDNSYTIYSINLNGKNLKKIKSFDEVVSQDIYFLTCYKGNIYYIIYYGVGGNLYKLNISSKKTTKLVSGCRSWSLYKNKLFYEPSHGDLDEYPLSSFDLKTEKNKIVLKSGCVLGENNLSSKLILWSYKVPNTYDKTINLYVYTSKDGKKFTKSKKLPKDSSYVQGAYSSGKYVIISIKNSYYKFNLKTGAKKKIGTSIESYDSHLDVGIKPSNSIYLVARDYSKNKISVKKLVGNKLSSCTIGGKLNIKNTESYWIAGNYIVVAKGNKLKTYKLKVK